MNKARQYNENGGRLPCPMRMTERPAARPVFSELPQAVGYRNVQRLPGTLRGPALVRRMSVLQRILRGVTGKLDKA